MSTQKRRKPSLIDRVIGIGHAQDTAVPLRVPANERLAVRLPHPLRIAVIGRLAPSLSDIHAMLAAEGYRPRTGTTLADVRRILNEGPLDVLYILAPLPGASLPEIAAVVRELASASPPYLVALMPEHPAPRRELILAGYDDILNARFSQERLAQCLVAAARRAMSATPQAEHSRSTNAVPAPDTAALYQSLIDTLPQALVFHDLSGQIVMPNAALATLTGHDPETLRSMQITQLCRPEDAELLTDQLSYLAHLADDADESTALTLPALPLDILCADGRNLPADLILRLLAPPPFGDRPLVQGVLREMSESVRNAQELQAIQEIVHVVATQHDMTAAMQDVLSILATRRGYARGSIWTLAPDGNLLNRQAAIGSPVPEQIALTSGITGRVARTRQPVFQPDVHADPDYVASDPEVSHAISTPILHDERLIGVITIESHAAHALEVRDLTFLTSLAIQLAGMIERVELHQTLERQATTDPITDLPNRQVLQQRLEQAVAQAQSGPVSILMLGVDAFKTTNELYGHAIADNVLRQIGQVLRMRLPEDHLLARYTSDQFVVLMEGVDRDRTISVAEDLRIAVATQLFTAAEQVEQLTVSIGAATCPDDAESATALVRAADHAMYLAKRAGCNQTFQSNSAFATLAAAHGRINDLLRQAPGRTLSLLISAMDQRLRERAGHSERVTRYAAAIGEALGLLPDEISQLRLAAYIHDIGMMSLPDALLRKPAALTSDERKLLRTVPASARGLLSQLDLPESVFLAVVHLREWWDGSGYPSGLRGDDIPLGARIVSVADAIDAMTSDRAHRDALSMEAALAQVQALAGSQFDPRIARAALRLRDLAPALRTQPSADPNSILDDDVVLQSSGMNGDAPEALQPFNYP
jgi:diguanylate cyclase (GGDEF)-like protein/PAS domain S-box-containing protein